VRRPFVDVAFTVVERVAERLCALSRCWERAGI
jgi:hypothetical protein